MIIRTLVFAALTVAIAIGGAVAMGIEERKAMARKSLDMWAAGAKIDAASVFTDDYVNHQEPLADGGVSTIDRDKWVAVVAANHEAFPDFTVEILRQVGEGDTVATHWRFSGTQNGPYEGQASSGRRTSWTGVQVDRFEGDRIAESWVVWDKFTQFRELGLID